MRNNDRRQRPAGGQPPGRKPRRTGHTGTSAHGYEETAAARPGRNEHRKRPGGADPRPGGSPEASSRPKSSRPDRRAEGRPQGHSESNAGRTGRGEHWKRPGGNETRSAPAGETPARLKSSRPDRPERRHESATGHASANKDRVRTRPPRAPVVEKDSPGTPAGPMRISKALSRAGLCSRRDAERWIAEGRVSVNGRVLQSPALDVSEKDRILVDGQPLPEADPPRLWRYHKVRGLVTTHRDPEGRPTVFDKLPPEMPRVISIGRLDFNTEGLLLLTNDGALARHMELPATGWLRRYRVRAHGRVTQADLDNLKDGIEIEGVRYGPIEATLDKDQGANVWLSIGLREGKNREVRKILMTLGLDVNRLIRV
jgi:23S rRNA pseudouridine2605 synthase